MDRPTELGEFLRHCRQRLSPEQIGLPLIGRRRTPGLRREEVAAVSGVGITWYTRLEQGRAASVSASVVDALAHTLLLDDAEWAHLRVLAGLAPPPLERVHSDDSVQKLLDALDPSPALAMDHFWNVVGWNSAHRHRLIDLEPVPPAERNLLRLVFAHAGVRALMADWVDEAPTLLAEYRADLAADHAHPEHRSLVDELHAHDADFRMWWAEHRVATFTPRLRKFRRADGTTFELEHHRLQLVAAPSIRLIAYLPVATASRTPACGQSTRQPPRPVESSMASTKRTILDVVNEDAYPLAKTDLVAMLEAADTDADVVMAVTVIDDDQFVDRNELEHRLDAAFGMPDAFSDGSALEQDSDWSARE